MRSFLENKEVSVMEILQIKAESRTELGKKAANKIRKAGQIPAILYSKKGVKHFSTTHKDVKPMVFTPDLKLAQIDIDGEQHKVLLKEIDFHPVTDDILHIDFLELVDGEPLNVEIPVRFKGESPGVKSGGKFITSLRKVRVKTTPEALVDELFADISSLKLGMSLRVMDLAVSEGIEVLANPSMPIASVIVPRALKDDDEEEEEEEEVEGEASEEAPAE